MNGFVNATEVDATCKSDASLKNYKSRVKPLFRFFMIRTIKRPLDYPFTMLHCNPPILDPFRLKAYE